VSIVDRKRRENRSRRERLRGLIRKAAVVMSDVGPLAAMRPGSLLNVRWDGRSGRGLVCLFWPEGLARRALRFLLTEVEPELRWVRRMARERRRVGSAEEWSLLPVTPCQHRSEIEDWESWSFHYIECSE
jgi:hypothetical protein